FAIVLLEPSQAARSHARSGARSVEAPEWTSGLGQGALSPALPAGDRGTCNPMTARTLAAWLALATFVGCGSRTTSEPAPGGLPAQPQPPCGMILDPASSFQCQARLDRACCAEQRACA